jgi:signal transduction histidine kinase
MTATLAGDFGRAIAARMHAEHQALAARWLARLDELLPVAEAEVFPTTALLDHIPALISEIASFLSDGEADEVAANSFVLDKARELGELRYDQQASVHQLLREYRVLAGILVTFVEEETRALGDAPPGEVIAVLGRVSQAVSVLQQTTVETFIAKYTSRIDEQRRRLENFNSLVSHELRQPIAAIQFAFRLAENASEPETRAGYRDVVERNLTRLVRMTDQLAMISRLKPSVDSAQTQLLPIELVAREVARQLRDMAEHRGVEICIPDGLPVVEVDVAAMELILVNLVANAIKYSDPAKPSRRVEIMADSDAASCRLIVRDNGMGIAPEDLPRIFDRAFRAHAHRDRELGTDGFGLGLAIVRDCIIDQGGQVAVESLVGEGTTFTVTLPRAGR